MNELSFKDVDKILLTDPKISRSCLQDVRLGIVPKSCNSLTYISPQNRERKRKINKRGKQRRKCYFGCILVLGRRQRRSCNHLLVQVQQEHICKFSMSFIGEIQRIRKKLKRKNWIISRPK